MLVQALTLVTAGQCVYTHQADLCPVGEESCWVDDLEAIPAYADGEDPYGKSGYQTILTWTAWTEAENSAHDLAAVQLRYPIGAPLGWLGIGFTADDSFFLNNEFTSTSYPDSAPFNGETMAEWTGDFSKVEMDMLYIDETCDSGQAGASYYGADGIVYGVLSNPDANDDAIITRITYDKFAAIREFIELGLSKHDHYYFFPFFSGASN
jgi:V8-like Glu-specific endopeptidase